MEQKELQQLLASNIKKFRALKKITQSELSEKINVSEDSIRRIELARQWPGSKILSQIAEVLEVDVYRLFLPNSQEFVVGTKKSNELKSEIANELHNYIDTVFDELLENPHM